MLSERKIYYWIPLLIELFALFNSVLIRYGIRYLYLVFTILGLSFFVRKKVFCKSNTYFFSIVVYIISVILTSILLLLSDASISIIMGAVIYVLPLLYWLSCDEKKLVSYFPQIIIGLKYPVLLIAILGIIQFYVSPDLFGIINLNGPIDPYVAKATSDNFSNWIFYLRATSILASPQVYGLFMILYVISFFSYAKKNALNLLLVSLYLFAGAHSGNKSFFLILLLYGGYYLIKIGSLRNRIVLIFISFSLLSVIIQFADEVSFLSRIVSVENLSDEEKEGRLGIYTQLLENVTFLGDGAGTHMSLNGEMSEEPAESYFLQILIELGVIPFVCFIFIFILNYIRNENKINTVLFFIALSMVFVHCFNAFVFFIMWGWFFVSPPSIDGKK